MRPTEGSAALESGEVGAPAAGSVAHVLVLADGQKAEVRDLLGQLPAWLESRVERVSVEPDVRAFCEARERQRSGDLPDLIVVLGGDGAMLAVASAFRESPVPTLGINFGRVGFLAACAASRWEEVLEGVLAGEGLLEPRMRLQADLLRARDRLSTVALNDVVVSRGAHQGMLTVSLFVGDDWVTTVRADGLILATPIGSTAYSLAAGGPILAPSMLGIVATPVASQGLANRPIVLPPDQDLRVNVEQSSGVTTLVVDGRGYVPMHRGESVLVRRHPVRYPLLSMPGLDPYRRLRSRLGWGGPEPDDPPRPEAEAPGPGSEDGREGRGGFL